LDQLDLAVAPPRPQPPRRPGEALPLLAPEPLQEEHLPARLLDPDPGGYDACVVDDDECPRRQLLRQISELPVARLSTSPGDDEEPRFVPVGRRLLGNQLRRELVVELACIHPTATLP